MRLLTLIGFCSFLIGCTAAIEALAAPHTPTITIIASASAVADAADVPSSTSSQLPTLTAALPTGTAAAENGRFPDLNDQYLTISEENQYLPFNYIMSETGEAGGWDYAV